MADTRIDEEEVGTCIARSALYSFIARAFAFPTEERLAAHRDTAGPLLSLVTTSDERVDRLLTDAVGALSGPGESLRRAHTAAFPPIESQDHPPHESAYASGDIFVQTDVMADVAAFYRAHGLQVGGRERERPDHICTELDFMGFMAHKEAHALEALGPDEVEECRRTQSHFLRDHLGCWGPAFGQRMSAFAPEGPYRLIGQLLQEWLELDISAQGVTPERVLDEPQPVPPPDDGSCGIDTERLGVTDRTSPPSVTRVDLRRPPEAR